MMVRSSVVAVVLAMAAASLVSGASAAERSWRGSSAEGGSNARSEYYRKGPKVKGYVARRGGYSYTYESSINTYGDSRSKFGGASSLRDPMLDRQTPAGPFDHGFFFDSGVLPRGGESPYMN